MNISIYGIGNFGYAFLKHLDRKYKNDTSVNLVAYDYNSERLNYIKENKSHPTLHQGVTLSDSIEFVDNTKSLIADSDILLLAVPSHVTSEALEEIKKYSNKKIIIANTAKALDFQTGNRLSELVASHLPADSYSYALLAGGTIADDLFKHEPLGIDIACEDEIALSKLCNVLESNNLHVYPSTDLIGVEYASAFKNIVSILAGIIHGMGFSYGAETHIISRTAQGIAEFCMDELGADEATFSIGSQCWGNDMWMSCTGNTRNRRFGISIGKSASIQDTMRATQDDGKLVEGVNTLKAIDRLGLFDRLPQIQLLYDVVITRKSSVEDLRAHVLRSHMI